MPRGDFPTPPSTLVIACGALAREIVDLKRINGWRHMTVQCLPAELHNYPNKIPIAVRAKIREMRADYDQVFVAYADCGTGGLLDRVLEEEGVARIPGAHCYQFYAGTPLFESLADAEPGTFYLTDFLTRHFDRLIWKGLGMDRHPQLADEYFRNYKKLVYLAQVEDDDLLAQARRAAHTLKLEFEHRITGYGDLERVLVTLEGDA
ncbi:MAG: DUF1638 domain-containing protein [Gammaproteobacteria bacterium]